MAVSEDEVRHVANLARLGLEPDRVAQLAMELNGILVHMDALAAADTSVAARETRELARGMPLRSDTDASDAPDASGGATFAPHAPLATARERMAPEMRDGFFLVPRLSTHGEVGEASENIEGGADTDAVGDEGGR